MVREGLFKRIEQIFDAFGWDVVKVKYGALQRAAFEEPGGDKLRDWIDNCPNQLYSALTYQGGAVWRERLMEALGDQGDVTALIDARSDDELAALMENLGGNCVETMAETFAAIDHDRPVCFLAYTIKGWGTPIAGHKDNHGGLMTKTQMADWQKHMGVAEGEEWEPFATVENPQALQAALDRMPFFAKGRRRYNDTTLPVPQIELSSDREISTQMAFYDPFVARGLDALNYACYQDARFMIVGTPSGVTLAPEGGAHQSIGTPLIGMSQDGLASFEPAFADELAVIMQWAFDYLQRDGEGDPDERTWLRDETGGSVYLRLTTNPIEQPGKRVDEDFRQGAIDGAYWLRKPGPNCDVVIAYQGAVAPEAIKAAGSIAEGRRDVGVLAVTSADRLNAGWTAAQRARARGNHTAQSHIETLLGQLPRDCKLVTVIDGHPATLSWLGAVVGHQTVPLGVEHFGQTGTIADLYQHFGIDAQSIGEKVEGLTPGRRVLHRVMVGY